MRRIVVIIVSLVAICAALAVVLVAANHHATSAAAAPVNPLRGDPTAATDARLLAAPLDRFGLALLAREAQTASGNVVISPLSIHDVLSLILNGAQGRTAAEMRHTLGLEGLSLPATDQAWADLIAAAQAGDHPAVQIADSLWLRDGVAFAPAFLAAGRDYFAASTSPLPTDPAKAADAINGWVDAHTAGLIKQIVDPSYFNDATILTVVNTVHVKAAWQTPFDPSRTEPAPFTLADGTTVQVPTMSDEFSGPVAQTPAYDAVALATKGPVTAWVVVPRNGQTADSLLTLLAPAAWTRSTGPPGPSRSCSTCRSCTPRFRPPTSSPSWRRWAWSRPSRHRMPSSRASSRRVRRAASTFSASSTRPCSTSTRTASRRPPRRPLSSDSPPHPTRPSPFAPTDRS